MSLNHYTKISTRGKFASKYKPAESKAFDSEVTLKLRKHKPLFNDFNEVFDSTKHYLWVEYFWYLPVFLKDGSRISKKSGDSDNYIKPFQDLLFNNLNADDSEVITVSATKVHSKEFKIKAIIRICDIETIK